MREETVYIAEDGTKFYSCGDCAAYEQKLKYGGFKVLLFDDSKKPLPNTFDSWNDAYYAYIDENLPDTKVKEYIAEVDDAIGLMYHDNIKTGGWYWYNTYNDAWEHAKSVLSFAHKLEQLMEAYK